MWCGVLVEGMRVFSGASSVLLLDGLSLLGEGVPGGSGDGASLLDCAGPQVDRSTPMRRLAAALLVMTAFASLMRLRAGFRPGP